MDKILSWRREKKYNMLHYFKRAVSDIRSNKFLNTITIITIALCILVVSSFALFFENACRIIQSQDRGMRIMVYLDNGFNLKKLPELELKIKAMKETGRLAFISKKQAMEQLKKDMASKSTFLDSLQDNPLPDALEITMKKSINNWSAVEIFAARLKKIPMIEDVEYGEKWLAKFLSIFNLFKITGYAISALFLMIALFITANTIRLAFYSRRQEVEIMRLVGATDRFIITPFYIEGFLQGIIGGVAGLGILLLFFTLLSSGIDRSISSYALFDIRFLSIKYSVLILVCSSFLGWLGCYLSLKQFLKY